MRGKLVLSAIFVLLPPNADATNEISKSNNMMVVCPHDWYSQDIDTAMQTLEAHGYTVVSYVTGPISNYPTVRVETILQEIDTRSGQFGWYHWSTHCPAGDVVVLECYPTTPSGNQKWESQRQKYLAAIPPYYGIGFYYGTYLDPQVGSYNWIGLSPSDLDVVIDNENTVVYAACCSSAVVAGDWGVREELGFSADVDDITAPLVANVFYGAMNGGWNPPNRSVGSAASITSFLYPYFAHMHGDGLTELSPVVVSVTPAPGSMISTETDIEIVFSAKVNGSDNNEAKLALSGGHGLLVSEERWRDGYKLTGKLKPFQPTGATVTIHASHVAPEHNTVGILDGDGVGPNGDDYQFGYTANREDTNYACGYESAHAFREADESIVVTFVTDPEKGAESFTVLGKSGSVLAVLPAEGGMFPRAYEANVGPVAEEEFLVLERDRDPATADTRIGPFLLAERPPYLAKLRALNGIVSSWEPERPTSFGAVGSRTTKTTTRPASDIAFLSSRSDFLDACHPIGDWWSQEHGWTSQYIMTVSSDPTEARVAFSEVFEAAIAAGYRRRPLAVIVGEANQGYEPEKNIVGTIYFDDSTGNCYWGSDTGCASDASIVDFDADGLPDMPWTRIVACTPLELENAVASALDYYENGNPSERTLLFCGDRYYCVPVEEPAATLDTIGIRYASEGYVPSYLLDSSYDCVDYLTRAAHAAATVNCGISEIVGMAPVSNRSRLPGDFFQKSFSPVFNIDWLYRPQRIALLMPGCGTLDTDRNNPTYYPSIVKAFFVADPLAHTTAVCAFGDMRGGWGLLHQEFAKEFFRWRFRKDVATIQEADFNAVRSMGSNEPGAVPYLRMAGAIGFPVTLGGMAVTGADEATPRSTELSLLSAPNPFNATTSIRFELDGLSRVSLSVYGTAGRRVRVLVDREVRERGSYDVVWDGRDGSGRPVASGVYFIRLDTGRETRTRKVTLLN